MKSLLTLVLIVLFGLNISQAQTNKIEVGLTAAAGMSRIIEFNNPTAYSTGSLPLFAYAFGASFQFKVSEVFSLVVQPNFEHKGTRHNFTVRDDQGNNLGAHTAVNNFNYINVPILARFSFGRTVKFFINVGPYTGYLVSQKSVVPGYKDGFYVDAEYDQTDQWSQVDLGVAAGAGVKIPFTDAFNFTVELRNNLGLSNLTKGGTFINFSSSRSHNATYCQMGLNFALGG